MEGMEEKLGSILNNPEMMQKIMGFAQSMNTGEAETPTAATPPIDANLLKAVSGMAKQSGVDREQQALLRALGPYLSHQRIQKLENAMRAARMAKLAISLLGRQDGKFQLTR